MLQPEVHRHAEAKMPRGVWSAKDERMYESIKESQLRGGRTEERAKEIAARTVNRRRLEEGRTEKKSYGGTGNPTAPLEERTMSQLKNRARELGIEGRSSMRKDDLVRAIRRKQGGG
jgi:hypothetical protein